MKLYHYDHCPFCIRVRVAAGILGLKLDLEALLNDEEALPIRLIGQKMVPILIREDGSAMPESLDIVAYLDRDTKRLKQDAAPKISALMSRMHEYSASLLYPRMVLLAFPEFATASAKAYFEKKKSERVGDFQSALAQTETYLPRLNLDLQDAAKLLGDKRFFDGDTAGLNDVLFFPLLRNVTMVKGAIYAQNLHDYVLRVAELSAVDVFFSQQI